MNELATFFSAFYSQFVLRDFMAKMVPGGVVLFSSSIALLDFQTITGFVENAPLWPWVFVAGVSWLIGIGLQGLGCKIGYAVKKTEMGVERTERIVPKVWFDLYVKCRQLLDRRKETIKKQELERLVVLRESTGISCVALTVAAFLLTIDGLIQADFNPSVWWFTGALPWLPVSAFSLFLFSSFFVVHAYYVQVMYEFMMENQPFVRKPKNKKGGNGK